MDINIHNASLTISAVAPRQYPASAMPEIALAGRSNVGKSSFINKLLNRNALARTSANPGKTATLNFYNIDDKLFFVDLPGYGYAKVSKTEREKWAAMIDTYLHTRPQLVAVLLLVDARHKPTENDVAMCNWIKAKSGAVAVVATKADKLSKTKLTESIEVIRKTLHLGTRDILLPFSAQTGAGREEAWAFIKQLCTEDDNA